MKNKISKSVLTIVMLLSASVLLSAQNTPQYYNSSNGTGNGNIPLNSVTSNKAQWLYVPGAFKTGGHTGTVAPPGMINSVYFRVGTPSSGTAVYDNFTIKLAQNVGTTTFWSSPVFLTNLDTGFYSTNYSLSAPVPGQWYKIQLQNMIPYDPTLSLVVEVCASAGTGNALLQPILSIMIDVCRHGAYSATSGSLSTVVIDFGFDLSPGITDAGLEGFTSLADTLCDGIKPVEVILKNFGQSTLNNVDIQWKVNNIPQPVFSWSGTLASNATTNIIIGNYPFAVGTSYNIVANTTNPNGISDTINGNDTASISEIFIKPTPGINLIDTIVAICQGDTAYISGTLFGTPPWNVAIDDGTSILNLNNLTNPSFSIPVSPSSTKIFTFTSITDATGCDNTSESEVLVVVQNAPSAVITPQGSTTACSGDSVMLMASIGLGFSYQWYLDGSILTNDTLLYYAAKTGGDYTVLVMSPAGCSTLSAPVNITVHPLPVVFLGNDTAVLPSQSILLNAGPGFNSYLWSTGSMMQVILVDSSGVGIGVKTVWVHVTDNYCTGGDTININFTHTPGINDVFFNADIRIIPNPSDGRIELQFSNIPAGQYDIEIFSPDGKAVYRSKHQLNNNKINIDLSHIANGVYLLKVSGTAGAVAERIMIRN